MSISRFLADSSVVFCVRIFCISMALSSDSRVGTGFCSCKGHEVNDTYTNAQTRKEVIADCVNDGTK